MITEHEAEAIAARLLGHPHDDADEPWHLVEFNQGWLIQQEPPPGEFFLGAPGLVIERGSGEIRRFSSGVAPGEIIKDYAGVRDEGQVVQADG